jgi:hypothetical protein
MFYIIRNNIHLFIHDLLKTLNILLIHNKMGDNGKDKKDIKENFCGSCLAIPFAIAGVGIAGAGGMKKGMHSKTRKIMLISGITLSVVSLIIVIWFLMRCKKCSG